MYRSLVQILSTRNSRLLLIIYLLSFAFVTLIPNDGKPHHGLLWFLSTSPIWEKFLNLLLLAPLPLLLYLVRLNFSTLHLFITAPCLSLSVELAQRWIPGRDSSARDFLLNSLGSIMVASCISIKNMGGNRP